MNLPGSGEGNWAWRYYPGQVDGGHAARLAELTAVYGRAAGRVKGEE
jgi:4-alpha-glucanotransferase